jgi:hypothetical protein
LYELIRHGMRSRYARYEYIKDEAFIEAEIHNGG